MSALTTVLPPGWRWQWRQRPYGACPRCRWPAHTLAPNGVPFHAFCWGNPDPVPAFDQWLRRKVAEQEAEEEGRADG